VKEQILALKQEGKSHNEIVAILGCSKASVSYHCSEKVKQSYRTWRNKNRKKSIRQLKEEAGGKCLVCGYDRCFRNLTFHHRDPSKKSGTIAEMVYSHSKTAAAKEVKKCILLCCRCHGEVHEGLITV
jgi:transcriptional regulator